MSILSLGWSIDKEPSLFLLLHNLLVPYIINFYAICRIFWVFHLKLFEANFEYSNYQFISVVTCFSNKLCQILLFFSITWNICYISDTVQILEKPRIIHTTKDQVADNWDLPVRRKNIKEFIHILSNNHTNKQMAGLIPI
jgi:hypothetical protein